MKRQRKQLLEEFELCFLFHYQTRIIQSFLTERRGEFWSVKVTRGKAAEGMFPPRKGSPFPDPRHQHTLLYQAPAGVLGQCASPLNAPTITTSYTPRECVQKNFFIIIVCIFLLLYRYLSLTFNWTLVLYTVFCKHCSAKPVLICLQSRDKIAPGYAEEHL